MAYQESIGNNKTNISLVMQMHIVALAEMQFPLSYKARQVE